MIQEDEMLEDVVDDAVRPYLSAFQRAAKNSVAKADAKAELVSVLKRHQYIQFVGHYWRYLASSVGDSYLYDVPMTKRGHLKAFRGQRVRVLCIESGDYRDRVYMVGAVLTPGDDAVGRARAE